MHDMCVKGYETPHKTHKGPIEVLTLKYYERVWKDPKDSERVLNIELRYRDDHLYFSNAGIWLFCHCCVGERPSFGKELFQIGVEGNCKRYLFKDLYMYLYKLLNLHTFSNIWMHLSYCKTSLFKFQNIFIQITNCIFPNYKIYLSKLQNWFVQ